MTYSPVLVLHICGAIVGLLSGSAALFFRKGSRLHRTEMYLSYRCSLCPQVLRISRFGNRSWLMLSSVF
jgi:hypothetical protein